MSSVRKKSFLFGCTAIVWRTWCAVQTITNSIRECLCTFDFVGRIHFKAINSSDSAVLSRILHKKIPAHCSLHFVVVSFHYPQSIGMGFFFVFSFLFHSIPYSCVPVLHPEILSSYLFCGPSVKRAKNRRMENILSNHNLHMFKVICVCEHINW